MSPATRTKRRERGSPKRKLNTARAQWGFRLHEKVDELFEVFTDKNNYRPLPDKPDIDRGLLLAVGYAKLDPLGSAVGYLFREDLRPALDNDEPQEKMRELLEHPTPPTSTIVAAKTSARGFPEKEPKFRKQNCVKGVAEKVAAPLPPPLAGSRLHPRLPAATGRGHREGVRSAGQRHCLVARRHQGAGWWRWPPGADKAAAEEKVKEEAHLKEEERVAAEKKAADEAKAAEEVKAAVPNESYETQLTTGSKRANLGRTLAASAFTLLRRYMTMGFAALQPFEEISNAWPPAVTDGRSRRTCKPEGRVEGPTRG
ncbi:hypothetical protein B0H63DRAFT_527052 [Podospora didyma]|uniref:Uncharacterized protein n=1 Tax=Podospora didyma TaxID=330526 RepID=A0AAE0KA76_9PEZI|nr:hypothetical protein B0H63DRAFT_527052 [Podospora didyma]